MTNCTKCGAEAIAGGLCPKCYKHENRLMETKSMSVRRCPMCKRYWISGRWVHADREEVLEHVVDKNLKVNASAQDLRLTITKMDGKLIKIGLSATLGEEPWNSELTRKFEIVKDTCETCSKRSGGYMEANVQIRADGRELEEAELEKIEHGLMELAKEDSIIKSKKVKGGTDYEVAPMALAKQMEKKLKNLGAAVAESSKAMGFNAQGKPVNQVNIVARFPAYRPEDIVKMDNTFFQVVKGGKKTSLKDFCGKLKTANHPVTLVVPHEEILEGMIVSIGPTIQFMDEEFKMHDLEKPTCKLEKGEKVKFIRIEDMIYPIWR